MAINPTLIKSIGGLAVVGGTGVAGYIYRGELSDIWNADNRVFLVQATTVNDASNDINKSGNYCSLKTEIDNDCQVVDLDFNEQKYVDSQKIINSSTAAKQLTNNSFYKLIVNRWKIKSLENNADVSIEIKNGSTSLATLKIISTMYESTPEKPVDNSSSLKILVQANKSVVETDDMTLTNNKCKFFINNADTDIQCDVYKFNNHSSGKHTLDFSKITKLTKFNEIQAGQYYILDFDLTGNDETAKKKITDESIKHISIKKDSTKKADLVFKSKIITNLKNDDTSYTNTQALLLNNFEKENSISTFIIAKSEKVTDTGFSSHKNNYKCELSQKTDTNCVIIELTDKEKTLLQITDADKLPTTINAADKYYKLIANNEITGAITDWSTTINSSIVIKSTASNNSTEYGKLKPLYQIENKKIIKGKTSLLIATANATFTTPTNITTSTTFKCTVENVANTGTDCDVYNFSDSPIDLMQITENLPSTLTKATENSHWAKGKVFLINLKTPEIDHSKTTETKNVKVKVTGESADITTLTIDAHLFNKDSFDGTTAKNLFTLT